MESQNDRSDENKSSGNLNRRDVELEDSDESRPISSTMIERGNESFPKSTSNDENCSDNENKFLKDQLKIYFYSDQYPEQISILDGQENLENSHVFSRSFDDPTEVFDLVDELNGQPKLRCDNDMKSFVVGDNLGSKTKNSEDYIDLTNDRSGLRKLSKQKRMNSISLLRNESEHENQLIGNDVSSIICRSSTSNNESVNLTSNEQSSYFRTPSRIVRLNDISKAKKSRGRNGFTCESSISRDTPILRAKKRITRILYSSFDRAQLPANHKEFRERSQNDLFSVYGELSDTSVPNHNEYLSETSTNLKSFIEDDFDNFHVIYCRDKIVRRRENILHIHLLQTKPTFNLQPSSDKVRRSTKTEKDKSIKSFTEYLLMELDVDGKSFPTVNELFKHFGYYSNRDDKLMTLKNKTHKESGWKMMRNRRNNLRFIRQTLKMLLIEETVRNRLQPIVSIIKIENDLLNNSMGWNEAENYAESYYNYINSFLKNIRKKFWKTLSSSDEMFILSKCVCMSHYLINYEEKAMEHLYRTNESDEMPFRDSIKTKRLRSDKHTKLRKHFRPTLKGIDCQLKTEHRKLCLSRASPFYLDTDTVLNDLRSSDWQYSTVIADDLIKKFI
ncbi:hypothetical protein SNEBB_011258 [Seison nebaliae]|nr:hypothetical protein SNEBB_011258 [Seison nebaliae]